VPADRKTLRQLVRDRTFLARRHAELLHLEPLVDDPVIRQLQERYRAEPSERIRRQVALEIEGAVRDQAVYARHGAATLGLRIAEGLELRPGLPLTIPELFAAEEELGPVALRVGTYEFTRPDERIASVLITFALGTMTLAQIADMHEVDVPGVLEDITAAVNPDRTWGPALARCADVARELLLDP
jgi:hypothetical protein